MKKISALSAVALTTLTFTTAWGLPAHEHNLSYALVWLLFMVIAGLPLAFIEPALVRRSRQLPLQGLAPVTREADAATFWRILAPMAMLSLVMLMGLAVDYSTRGLVIDGTNSLMTQAFPFLLIFLAMGFAWVGMTLLLPVIGFIVPAVLAINVLLAPHNLTFALLTPEEWQNVALAALLANVSTLGVSAWLSTQFLEDERASSLVMPLWLTQTLVGALTIAAGTATGNISMVVYMLSAVFTCAILAEVVGRQLLAKPLVKPVAYGLVVLAGAVATAAVDYVVFDYVLKVLALLTILGFALLSGWVMKISHVRKALNFGSEGVYNLWRVGVRIVVPITVLWLLVGMVATWLKLF